MDIILTPAVDQLNALNIILQQKSSKMLEINRGIAEAMEERHKVNLLRANGLLDADACATRMNIINAKITQLRGERRKSAENEALGETIEAIRKVINVIQSGPEHLSTFDEGLFNSLVEKIVAESQLCVRFHLYGGLELTERLEEPTR